MVINQNTFPGPEKENPLQIYFFGTRERPSSSDARTEGYPIQHFFVKHTIQHLNQRDLANSVDIGHLDEDGFLLQDAFVGASSLTIVVVHCVPPASQEQMLLS
jgi:hypothetical protein